MRVAIFTETYFPYISGVVTHVKTLSDELKALGHQVLIVSACPKSRQPENAEDVMYCHAIPLKKLYGYGLSNPLNLASYKHIADFAPDIIHVHTEFSIGWLGIIAARYLRVPVVYTLHTMYDDYLFYLAPARFEKLVRPAVHLYFKGVAQRAEEIIGPSEKVVELLRRWGVKKHAHIIPNTVNTFDFLPENCDVKSVAAARNKMGLEAGDLAFIFVGRLGKEKSVDVLIDCFAAACINKPHAKLIIIGDGPEADALREKAVECPVFEQIKFLGRIEHRDIAPYYNAADLFCTASTTEINSISMLEAMAAGLFVFQKLDVYNAGQITRGVNGDIFEDTDDFCRLVERYDALTTLQKQRIRTGVSTASQIYNEKVFCDKILKVYNRALISYKNKKRVFSNIRILWE